MDIREAFNAVMSLILEHDRHFDHKYLLVERHNLRRNWWRVLETAVDAEGDYLAEDYNLIINVSRRDDGYLVRYQPFAWVPHNRYGISRKMFNYLFRKYDPQLVSACLKVAEESDGMLYSEVKETNGVQRCHYGVRVYNNHTDKWDGVYEGTFPVES